MQRGISFIYNGWENMRFRNIMNPLLIHLRLRKIHKWDGFWLRRGLSHITSSFGVCCCVAIQHHKLSFYAQMHKVKIGIRPFICRWAIASSSLRTTLDSNRPNTKLRRYILIPIYLCMKIVPRFWWKFRVWIPCKSCYHVEIVMSF